jgi:hypothetical protein
MPPILRYVLWIMTAVLAIVVFGVVTPFAFLAAAHIRPNDWAKFSNEGQAYGGIASVIGMLAIIGVVASLILQARKSAANRLQIDRAFHADLLYKAFEDPELLECWGIAQKDAPKMKKVAYVNLIVSYWAAMVEIGRMNDSEVRASAADIFAGMPARDLWRIARSGWMEFNSGDFNRKFYAIMDEEYWRAMGSGPVSRWPERKTSVSEIPDERSMIRGLAVGAACGAAIAGATAAILRHSRLP